MEELLYKAKLLYETFNDNPVFLKSIASYVTSKDIKKVDLIGYDVLIKPKNNYIIIKLLIDDVVSQIRFEY